MKRKGFAIFAVLIALFSFCNTASAQTPDEMPLTRDLSSVFELMRVPVFFDYHSYQVKEVDYREVRELVKFLNEHQEYMVEVYAYCRPGGDPKEDEYRSFYRANAVCLLLVQMGLDGRRIIDMDGLGADNTITERSLYDMGQRAEIVIVRFDYD